jgi:hypothetical protein
MDLIHFFPENPHLIIRMSQLCLFCLSKSTAPWEAMQDLLGLLG